jgi:hypothetical protein
MSALLKERDHWTAASIGFSDSSAEREATGVLPGREFEMVFERESWRPNPKDKDWYLTDAITDRAIKFVEGSAKEKPFFLYLSCAALGRQGSATPSGSIASPVALRISCRPCWRSPVLRIRKSITTKRFIRWKD